MSVRFGVNPIGWSNDDLRELGGTNPALTLQLAREASARFPDGAGAPELTWYVVKSLTDLGRFDEAVAEAKAMVQKYPDDSFALDVERHLLSNPLRPDAAPAQ